MTLVIIGLDALDAGLVEHFECDGLKLETHCQMETFSYMKEVPYTPEVWPTMATGLHPREHGVAGSGISEWDDPVVDFLSRFTGHFSVPIRTQLGDWAEWLTGAQYRIGTTDQQTFFDGPDRTVQTWPGVTSDLELVKVWKTPKPDERQTVSGFERDLRGIGIQHFAWAREMLDHKLALAGTHDHTLDMGGHVYSKDETRLQELYKWAEKQVKDITSGLDDNDELLIVSDHGMVTDFFSDEGDRGAEPGIHSWRAFAASTADTVPESVYEVFDWVERHVEDVEHESEPYIDVPEEQLRDLGYM